MLSLTAQETKVLTYLLQNSQRDIAFEELTQFAKYPNTVKLKTIRKVISDLKKKYADQHLSFPFTKKFYLQGDQQETVKNTFVKLQEKSNSPVQVKIVPSPSVYKAEPSIISDFVLDPYRKMVRTKYGYHQLGDNEWEVMKYICANIGKIISLSELRDKVLYPNYGSKLPARWFNSILRVVNNLRKSVPDLSKRLLTIKDTETSYLFQ